MANYIYFTEEQISELQKNPYVLKVSDSTITYSQEFREEFYKSLMNGGTPSQILTDMGFDTKVLGKQRVNNITKRIKKMASRYNGFEDTRKGSSGRPATKELSPDEQIAYLQHQLKFKDQQIEALKKMNFINKKAQWKQQKKNSK